jgi:predicted Zn-dependent peptidase
VAGVLANARPVITQDARVIYRVLPEQPNRESGPRDVRPADGVQTVFVPPAPERFTLTNGMPVELWQTSALPLTSVSIVFQPGGPLVFDARSAGLASLTADMLDEGAGDLDTLQFSDAVAAIGGQFSTAVARESLEAKLTVLSSHFSEGAGLLADAVRAPRMQAEDFERVKRLALDQINQSDENPDEVARRVVQRTLFGADHPYAWTSYGTRESVGASTLAAVKAAQAQWLRPDIATLLVAGNLSATEARAVLEKAFGTWTTSATRAVPAPAPARYATTSGGGLRVYLVNRPDAQQTSVRFAAPAPRFDDPSRVRLGMLGTILGGSFTSRLNQNLREQHGYTYGASAQFSLGKTLGTFKASANVTTRNTGAALTQFLAEFARFSSGDISEAEAGKAREAARTDAVQAFSANSSVVAVATELLGDGASFETLGDDLAALSKQDLASLNASARTAIALDHGVLVLVGDKAAILPQLQGLGLPAPIEVDAWGAVIAPR